jgi:flavin-binding protein dodecin
MSVAKVIELHAEGSTIETAIENAVDQASLTIHNVKHVYVDGIQAIVSGNRVEKYRVNAKITFVIDKA